MKIHFIGAQSFHRHFFFFFKLAFTCRPKVFKSTGQQLRRWEDWTQFYTLSNFATCDEKTCPACHRPGTWIFISQLSNVTVRLQGLYIFCTQRDLCSPPEDESQLWKLERHCKKFSSRVEFCGVPQTPGVWLYSQKGYITICCDLLHDAGHSISPCRASLSSPTTCDCNRA